MPSEKRVTLADVSKEAGLGLATVSRALRPEHHPDVSARTRDKVRRVADRLGYQPSYAAKALRSGSTGVIALVVTSQFLDWWQPAITGALGAAATGGYETIVYPLHIEQSGTSLADTLMTLPAEGVVLLGGADDPVFQAALVARRMPAVGVDAVASSSHISSVSVDNARVITLALEHLQSTGRNRTAYIGTDDQALDVGVRRRTFIDTMTARGEGSPIVFSANGLDDGTSRFSEELAAQFTTAEFDSVICEHDRLAVVAMRTLAHLGRDVPRDVAVVGIDNTELTIFTTPTLTSVAQPLRDLGATAVQILLASMGRGSTDIQHQVLQPTLVARESTA